MLGKSVRFTWEGQPCEGIVEHLSHEQVHVKPTKGAIFDEYPWNTDPATPVILDPQDVALIG